MAVRTRKSTSTLPSEPVVEPASAPTRRRVPGTRAAATRRPATSSRTLRPIIPPEALAAEPLAEPSEESVAESPFALPIPTVESNPAPSAQRVSEPAAEAPVEVLVVAPAVEVLVVVPAAEVPAPEVAAELLLVAPVFESPAPEASAAELVVAPGAELPAPETTAEVLGVEPTAELTPPVLALPLMVEQLQADVRALQGLVTGHTEQTVHELGRTTMQMVRMVTGVAHHLDQLAEQVQQLSGVAQTLAQALTRVEGTVATLQARTQDQLLLAARGQRELQDILSPVLSELVALRTQDARNTSMERLDQFRMGVELKQLRQAVEKHGPTPEVLGALPRPSRARPKR